jgi:hypothetical protein
VTDGSVGRSRDLDHHFGSRFGRLKLGNDGYFVVDLVLGVLAHVGDYLKRNIHVLRGPISKKLINIQEESIIFQNKTFYN